MRNFSVDKQFLGTYLNVEFTEYGTAHYSGQTVNKKLSFLLVRLLELFDLMLHLSHKVTSMNMST
jgi:hypothetical protein